MKSFTQFLFEGAGGSLEAAKHVILTLRQHGYQGYLVGGCVRDMLLGMNPKDIDIATDAIPDQLTSIFPGSQLVGEKFGVVIVNGIDVATFRKDGIYSDGRRPDSVAFTKTPQEDAARRYFTWNALFMDPFTGDILDFFGGQDDLKNKILRTVGSADERFTQDHLRIMRADRFAGRYGFKIHPDTEAAMTTHSHHLASIDVERITQELTKSLAHDPMMVVTSMKRTGVLKTILPEVDSEPRQDFDTTIKVLSEVGRNTTTEFGFCALLFKLPVSTITSLSRRLKFTNDLRDHILGVMALQPRIEIANPHVSMDVLKKLMRDKYFSDALRLFGMRVHTGEKSEYGPSFHFLTNLYNSLNHEDLNPVRFVTGDDLIRVLGMKPGKEFKTILDTIENGQLNGTIKTREQALEIARKMQK